MRYWFEETWVILSESLITLAVVPLEGIKFLTAAISGLGAPSLYKYSIAH